MKESIEKIIPAILDNDFNLSIPIVRQGKVNENPGIGGKLDKAIYQFIDKRRDPMLSIDLVTIRSGWIARICEGDPELHQSWIELAWGDTREIAISNARQKLEKLLESCCEN